MTDVTPSPGEAAQHAETGARHATPWVERLARLGYVTIGIVYIIIGVLAAQAAAETPHVSLSYP